MKLNLWWFSSIGQIWFSDDYKAAFRLWLILFVILNGLAFLADKYVFQQFGISKWIELTILLPVLFPISIFSTVRIAHLLWPALMKSVDAISAATRMARRHSSKLPDGWNQ